LKIYLKEKIEEGGEERRGEEMKIKKAEKR